MNLIDLFFFKVSIVKLVTEFQWFLNGGAWPHPTPIRVGWGHAPPSSQLVRAMASFEVPEGGDNVTPEDAAD
ncbi:MAG: hypothetical protein ABW124_21460, partial [Candidatus Thiodiazotropha sp. 6PLUC9]